MHARTRVAMRVAQYRHTHLRIRITKYNRRITESSFIILAFFKERLSYITIGFQSTILLHSMYTFVLYYMSCGILMNYHDTNGKDHT